MSVEQVQRDGRDVFVLRCDGTFEGEPCDEEAVFTLDEIDEEGGLPDGWLEVYGVTGWRCLCRMCDENEFPYPRGRDFETKVEWNVRDIARKEGPDDPFLDQSEEDVLRYVASLPPDPPTLGSGRVVAAAFYEYWKRGQLWRAEP